MSNMIAYLERLIADRRENPRDGSYTNSLMNSGISRMAQKVGEEATEVIVAALSQEKHEQIAEISDLLFHLLVLMNERGITLAEIDVELERRHRDRRGES